MARLFHSDFAFDVMARLFHSDFAFSGATIGGAGGREEGTGFPGLVVVWREWMEPWEAYRTTGALSYGSTSSMTGVRHLLERHRA